MANAFKIIGTPDNVTRGSAVDARREIAIVIYLIPRKILKEDKEQQVCNFHINLFSLFALILKSIFVNCMYSAQIKLLGDGNFCALASTN